ncbi:hypothetical protein Tco_0504867, partial [Tanacetum coccineum]
ALASAFEWVIDKLGSVIRDYYLRKPKPAHDVVPYKLLHVFPGNHVQRFCFDPLCEVIDGYDDELQLFEGLGQGPKDVHSPLGLSQSPVLSGEAGDSKDAPGPELLALSKCSCIQGYSDKGIILTKDHSPWYDTWLTVRTKRESPTLEDEGLSSGGTKLNPVSITAEVTFTKPKQPTTGREESQGQTNKAGEPEDTIQPPPVPYKEITQTDEKDEEEDESLEKSLESKPPEKVVIHNDYPDQTITIGGNLSTKYRSILIEVLRKHVDAFTWTLADMTGIPRFVAKHELKTYPHIEPRVQRKRSIAPDKRKVVKDEVAEWLKARIVRRVRYPTWVANPVLVKNPDGSWRMCIDFKDLNKACSKDLYPLPEIDWKIESLMGFKYKCFLDAYKRYHQIQLA